MARFCAECGTERPADAIVCPTCGAAFGRPSPESTSQAGPDARPYRSRVPARRTLAIAALALVLVAVAAFLVMRGRPGSDPAGAEVVKSDDEIALYNFELFPLRVGDRCGYVDIRTGENRISPQFDRAEFFTAAGFAAVQINGRWGLIDRTGRVVVSPQFESLHYLGGPGLFAVPRGGMIDGTGRIVASSEYQILTMFDANGLASFQKGASRGCINTRGETVQCPPGGGGAVARDQGFSSPVERPTIPRSRVHEDLSVASSPQDGSVQSPRWGYVDRTGRFVIPAQFDGTLPFNGAPLAPVLMGNRWGFVDRTGAIRINPQFERADSFRNESGDWLALVQVAGRGSGFIGLDGVLRISPQFNIATPFDHNGRAIVQVGERRGLIDTSGRYVANPTFDAIMRLTGMTEYLFVRLPPDVHPTGPGYQGPPERAAMNSTNIEFGLIDRDGRILSSFRGGACPASF